MLAEVCTVDGDEDSLAALLVEPRVLVTDSVGAPQAVAELCPGCSLQWHALHLCRCAGTAVRAYPVELCA